jgi:hypothetical protein
MHSSAPAQAPLGWGDAFRSLLGDRASAGPAAAPAQPPAREAAPAQEPPFATLPSGKAIKSAGYADLYHGSADLDEAEVAESGLPARGNDRRLFNHVEPQEPGDAANSAFRSATPYLRSPADDGQGAMNWAGESGLVVHYTAHHVDPGKELEGRIRMPNGRFRSPLTRGEGERTTEARIPQQHIKRWGRVTDGQVRWVDNPHYADPRNGDQ